VGGVFRFLEGSQVALGDHSFFANFARTLSVKFKQLIKGLKVKSKELSRLNTLIHNSSWVLAFLDGLEEAQSLTITEKNFRAIVKNYLTKLLKQKELTGSKELLYNLLNLVMRTQRYSKKWPPTQTGRIRLAIFFWRMGIV
jgi:hypothetical protein